MESLSSSFGNPNPRHNVSEMEEGGFSPRQFNPNQSEVRHDHEDRKVSDRVDDEDDDDSGDERPKATSLSAAPD